MAEYSIRRRMARRTPPKPKSRSTQKSPQTPNPSGVVRHIRPLAKALFASILAVATIGGGLIAAWPHVRALPPDEAIDLDHPFVLSFSFHNGGNLPVYDAEVQCH